MRTETMNETAQCESADTELLPSSSQFFPASSFGLPFRCVNTTDQRADDGQQPWIKPLDLDYIYLLCMEVRERQLLAGWHLSQLNDSCSMWFE